MLIHYSKNKSLIFATRRRNTFYQRHNFHITGVNVFKSYEVQVETCTDMSLLRWSRMAPFKSRNKLIPGTL
jgi:hypothetical protein